MKRRVFSIMMAFFCIIVLISVLFVSKLNNHSSEAMNRRQLVEVNRIRRITQTIAGDENAKSVNEINESVRQYEIILQNSLQRDENRTIEKFVLIESLICFLFLFIVFGYVYIAMLRPFDKMRAYADEIAKGNFNVSLRYERRNYFGAFTWAFDNMRKELIKARSSEKEAVLNNKTVIATLSHDIKTPIASICAYCEGLEANLDSDIQKRADYISVIQRKCDEVTNLTNDLLLHSIADLDKLKIDKRPENIKKLLIDALEANNKEICLVRLIGYLNKKLTVGEVKKRAQYYIESFGLDEAKNRLPKQTSGGEQQRAAIARALINEPKILFADEPTGALNRKNGTDVLDILNEVNNNGQSILMVTHDIKAAIRGNRLLYISDGKIIDEMSLAPYDHKEVKARETQVNAWLSSLLW